MSVRNDIEEASGCILNTLPRRGKSLLWPLCQGVVGLRYTGMPSKWSLLAHNTIKPH